jgi:TrmH family RNA methyltransferase
MLDRGRMESISSRHNPIVKAFRAAAQGRSAGRLLLEGARLVEEALQSGVPVSTAAVTVSRGGRADGSEALVAALEAAGAHVIAVSKTVMAAISPVRTPSGIVALADHRPAPLDAAFGSPPQLVLILARLQDPGNVGAIIRAADAAGATGVISCAETADPFGWKALRGAMGSTFRLPVVARETEAAAIAAARARGLRVVAATPRDGRSIYDVDLRGPLAVLLGGEGGGLAPEAERMADERVSIPMRRPVESLNVAVSAALLLYEAHRQRRRPRLLPPDP